MRHIHPSRLPGKNSERQAVELTMDPAAKNKLSAVTPAGRELRKIISVHPARLESGQGLQAVRPSALWPRWFASD
jgi:hypothetical protein